MQYCVNCNRNAVCHVFPFMTVMCLDVLSPSFLYLGKSVSINRKLLLCCMFLGSKYIPTDNDKCIFYSLHIDANVELDF